jgi:hypothetical protein
VKSEAHTVSTTAAAIYATALGHGGAGYPGSVAIKNIGAVTVYIGGSDVSSSNGFPLNENDSLEADLVNDQVYAVVASSTQEIRILFRGL